MIRTEVEPQDKTPPRPGVMIWCQPNANRPEASLPLMTRYISLQPSQLLGALATASHMKVGGRGGLLGGIIHEKISAHQKKTQGIISSFPFNSVQFMPIAHHSDLTQTVTTYILLCRHLRLATVSPGDPGPAPSPAQPSPGSTPLFPTSPWPSHFATPVFCSAPARVVDAHLTLNPSSLASKKRRMFSEQNDEVPHARPPVVHIAFPADRTRSTLGITSVPCQTTRSRENKGIR